MPTPSLTQSLQALKHCLRKSWKSVSLSTLQNLIGSMPNRLKAVTKNNGDTIHTNSEHGQRHRLTLMFITLSVRYCVTCLSLYRSVIV